MSRRKRRLVAQRGDSSVCAYPEKERYTRVGARDAVRALRARGRLGLSAYRCPDKGHWHVGRRRMGG